MLPAQNVGRLSVVMKTLTQGGGTPIDAVLRAVIMVKILTDIIFALYHLHDCGFYRLNYA